MSETLLVLMNEKPVSPTNYSEKRSFYRGSIGRPSRDAFGAGSAFIPTAPIRLYDGPAYSDSLVWRYKQAAGRTRNRNTTIGGGRKVVTRLTAWRDRYHPLPLIIYSVGVAILGFLLNVH